MKRFLHYIFVLLVSLLSVHVISAKDQRAENASGNINEPLKGGQSEEATDYTEEKLPDSNNLSYHYFKLAQTELNKRDSQSSFVNFEKAIECLPQERDGEILDPEKESQINIATLMRTNNLPGLSLLILNNVLANRPDYSSALYGISYIKFNQNKLNEYFEYYYKAYKINPQNPHAIAGIAMLQSIIGSDPPSVDNFPWLDCAAHFYDNNKVWTNVIADLYKNRMLTDAAIIKKLSQKLPADLRPVFLYHCFKVTGQDDAALKSLLPLKEQTRKDYRFDVFRRKALVAASLDADAIKGFENEPSDIYERIYYYEFWVKYYSKEQSVSAPKSIGAIKGYLSSFSSFVTSTISSGDVQRKAISVMVFSLATSLIEEHNLPDALFFFELYESNLGAVCCEIAASLCFQMGKFQEATKWLERQLGRSGASEKKEILRRIIDYAVLADNTDLAAQYTDYAKNHQIEGIDMEYAFLSDPNILSSSKHYYLPNVVPGHYSLQEHPVGGWALGICAKASAYSVLNFYSIKIDHEQVSQDFESLSQPSETFSPFESYFKSKGLSTIYLVPTEEVAKELIAKKVPLLLLTRIFSKGASIGHVNILMGFDDRLGIFFSRDTFNGESRRRYEDIIDSIALMLVAPDDKIDTLIPKTLSPYIIPSPNKVLMPERFDELAKRGIEASYWALRHNGTHYTRKDFKEAVSDCDNALALRQPSDVAFFEDVVPFSILANKDDITHAYKYIEPGLSKNPNSLLLLKYYVEIKRDIAVKKNKLDATLAQHLLNVTAKMEDIDPDYAQTYFIRGSLLLKGSMNQASLTSFQTYIEKYPAMPEKWKNRKRNIRYKKSAEKAIAICRIILSDSNTDN